MRLASSIILISAAILACDTSSAMRDVNPRLRPGIKDDSVIPAKRSWGTHDTSISEERAPTLLVTEAVLPDFMIAKDTMLNNLKRGWERPLRNNPIKYFRNGPNDHVPEALHEAMMNERPVARDSSGAKKSRRQKQAHAAPSNSKVQSTKQVVAAKKKKEQEAKERSATVEAWMSEGLTINDVVLRLQQNKKDKINVLKDSNLRTLQLFINQYKMKHKTEDTLLQALVKGFSKDYSLARMLSIAKEDPDDRFLASALQTQLMEGWLKDGKSVEDVYSMMKIAPNASWEKKFVLYTLVDTMDTYIGLYNKAHPDDPFDAMMYLWSKANDLRILGIMYAQAKSMGHDVSKHEARVYIVWLIEGIDPEMMYFHLISAVSHEFLYFVNRIVSDYATFYKSFIGKRDELLTLLKQIQHS